MFFRNTLQDQHWFANFLVPISVDLFDMFLNTYHIVSHFISLLFPDVLQFTKCHSCLKGIQGMCLKNSTIRS